MASAIYPKFKEGCLTQSPSIVFGTDTLKARLVNRSATGTGPDYTYNTGHDFINDVTAFAGTTDQTLGSKTMTNGVFDAADSVFSAVAAQGAKEVDGVVLYKDTGTPATSPLIVYIEFTGVVPNGGNITIQWNGSGIFTL